MSRSDAHRPAHVWLADHPELRETHHDHRTGPCNLTGPYSPCHSDPTASPCWVSLDSTVRLCSCNLCSNRHGRARARRAERTALRLLTRHAAAGCDDELLEHLEAALLTAHRRAW